MSSLTQESRSKRSKSKRSELGKREGRERRLLSLLISLTICLPLSLLLHVTVARGEAPFSNSQFIDVEGIEIHYRQWIPERVEGSLLLVHGLGGSTFSWRNNVEALKEAGYHVLAVDLPAFGYSDRKKDLVHSQENRSRWLWELIDSLAPEVSSWHLIGHSMGGGTITAMALENPYRVSSLIYVAGAVGSTSRPGGRLLAYPPFSQIFSFVARTLFFRERMIERALTSAYGTSPSREEIDGYLQPFLLEGTSRAWADLVGSASFVSTEGLKELAIPSLLIWGDGDTWVPLSQGESLKEELSKAQLLLIEDSGHAPQETHASKVNAAILDFLEDLSM